MSKSKNASEILVASFIVILLLVAVLAVKFNVVEPSCIISVVQSRIINEDAEKVVVMHNTTTDVDRSIVTN